MNEVIVMGSYVYIYNTCNINIIQDLCKVQNTCISQYLAFVSQSQLLPLVNNIILLRKDVGKSLMG